MTTQRQHNPGTTIYRSRSRQACSLGDTCRTPEFPFCDTCLVKLCSSFASHSVMPIGLLRCVRLVWWLIVKVRRIKSIAYFFCVALTQSEEREPFQAVSSRSSCLLMISPRHIVCIDLMEEFTYNFPLWMECKRWNNESNHSDLYINSAINWVDPFEEETTV